MSGFRHVRLLHDNAPSHTSELVKQFLKSGKVTVLPHLPYSPDLSPFDFFSFFQNLKSSYLVVVTSPDKPLAQPSVSASEVYLNQRTVTHFRNGFRD